MSAAETVRSALADLPVDQRVTVVLVDGEGFDHREAAKILGVAPGHGRLAAAPRPCRPAPDPGGGGAMTRDGRRVGDPEVDPDAIVRTALQLLPIPPHDDDFWTRLEATLDAEPPHVSPVEPPTGSWWPTLPTSDDLRAGDPVAS